MDMIVTYKIIQGLVCVPCRELFVLIWQVQDQMDSNYIKNMLELIQAGLHDFKNRVINDWNSLPPYIRSQCFRHNYIQDTSRLNLRFVIL